MISIKGRRDIVVQAIDKGNAIAMMEKMW
jgi:hypothetical protein